MKTKEEIEIIRKKFQDLLGEPIDWMNIDARVSDVWLFLTNDKRPESATITKEAFNHEVRVMVESLIFHHSKIQSIAYAHWLFARVGLVHKEVPPPPEIADNLYTLFLEHQSQPLK
jgi:hypothetical protein